jgi:6-phosphofructokinase 1
MKRKLGIINSGGDSPGLNTVIDAIVKSLSDEYDILGFIKGFEGLLDNDYIVLEKVFTSQNRWIGGTFLKSVNKGRFPGKIGHGEIAPADQEILTRAYKNYQDLGLEGLIVLGGDGTLSMASNLQKFGFNIVGVPKSIDNDLAQTDFTFGFLTAVQITNEALDRLHTTATSHERVMVLEVMGRDAGWIGLYSGMAGGANVILIPEIPFSLEKIKQFIEARVARGRKSSLIVVSEGAKAIGGEVSTKTATGGSEVKLGGIGEQVEKYLNEAGIETRSTTLGHVQRGGSPVSFDRILSTRLGAGAAELFREKKWGKMVTFKNNEIHEIDIVDAIKELKLVDPQSQIIRHARSVGISFGD